MFSADSHIAPETVANTAAPVARFFVIASAAALTTAGGRVFSSIWSTVAAVIVWVARKSARALASAGVHARFSATLKQGPCGGLASLESTGVVGAAGASWARGSL